MARKVEKYSKDLANAVETEDEKKFNAASARGREVNTEEIKVGTALKNYCNS